MTSSPNSPQREPTRDRRRTAQLAGRLARLGPIYNVCAHRRQQRLLKETLTAATPEAAIDLGRTMVRERGFALDGITFTAVRVAPHAVAEAVAADPRRFCFSGDRPLQLTRRPPMTRRNRR